MYQGRFLILFSLSFILSLHTLAQNQPLTGDWYIMYSPDKPGIVGAEYSINISKNGNDYSIIQTGAPAPGYLPDAGIYTADNDGNLVRNDLKLTFIKDRILFDNKGHVELINKQKYELGQSYFRKATAMLDAVDTINDNTKKMISLRRCRAYFGKVLEINDNSVVCYFNLSIVDYRLGDIDSTIADINHLTALDSNFARLPELYKLVSEYYVHESWDKYGKSGDYAGAIKSLKTALSYDGQNANAWYNLGGAYYSGKQYAEATDAFKKTLELQPNHKEARQGLKAAQEAFYNK